MKKQITFLVVILTVAMVFAGCDKKVSQGNQAMVNNQESNNYQSTITPIKNNDSQILKIVGQDKNGWNIYQSDKYGFEISAPLNFIYKNVASNDKNMEYFSFQREELDNTDNDFFEFGLYKNYLTNINIKDKKDLAIVKCGDNKSCNSENLDVLEFDKVNINHNSFIRTIEYTGINYKEELYYLISDAGGFVFYLENIPQEEKIKILNSFKLIEN